MSWSYLIILLLSISFPLYKTFGKPLYLSKQAQYLIPAIVIIAAIFIAWDIYFTNNGFWGFNPKYVTGIYLGPLPIEEVLFFLVIPYCCMFIYEVVRYLLERQAGYFNKIWIHAALVITFTAIMFLGKSNAYTRWASAFALIILLVTWVLKARILGRFYLSFLITLVPFAIVNGILTGTALEEPIVWYNNSENLSIRAGTIPIEDFIYCFGMLLGVALLYEIFKGRKQSDQV